jgi:ubiquinone/menaquinone biosynthesis C-methylase UbiE
LKSVEERISDEKYSRGTEIDRTSKRYTVELLAAEAPMTVLDIGCGTGMNSARLVSAGHSVFGVDISSVAIEQYRSRGFEGMVCDVSAQLPFEDERFDAVLASEVVEHLADTETFLSGVFRLLKPGGELVLSTPNSAFWVYRVLGLFGRTLSELQHPGHLRFFTRRSLRRGLERAGFVRIQMSGRNIYLLLSTTSASVWSRPLAALGFRSEGHFGTDSTLWHVSRFARSASGFWTDTLIVRARRPDPSDAGR